MIPSHWHRQTGVHTGCVITPSNLPSSRNQTSYSGSGDWCVCWQPWLASVSGSDMLCYVAPLSLATAAQLTTILTSYSLHNNINAIYHHFKNFISKYLFVFLLNMIIAVLIVIKTFKIIKILFKSRLDWRSIGSSNHGQARVRWVSSRHSMTSSLETWSCVSAWIRSPLASNMCTFARGPLEYLDWSINNYHYLFLTLHIGSASCSTHPVSSQ